MQALGRPPVPIRFGTQLSTKETRNRQRLEISRKESFRAAARHFPGIELAVTFGRQLLCEFETKIPAHRS